MAGLEKLGYKHAFQPYSYSLRPFSKAINKAIHRLRPPSLYRVKVCHCDLKVSRSQAKMMRILSITS